MKNYDLYILLCYFKEDACYACPTNKVRNWQQNNENKTKLESLKEMVKLNFTKPNHIIPDWKKMP